MVIKMLIVISMRVVLIIIIVIIIIRRRKNQRQFYRELDQGNERCGDDSLCLKNQNSFVEQDLQSKVYVKKQ